MNVRKWASLPSHQEYIVAIQWYWRTCLGLLAAVAFAYVLNSVFPYPLLPLPIYMIGFVAFPGLLAIAIRHTLTMVRLRREEILQGEFGGAPRHLISLDRHALSVGIVAILTAVALGIVVTHLRR